MHCAAFIAYPLTIFVDADRVQFAQYAAAFRTDTDNCAETISAEDKILPVFRVFPGSKVFPVLAYKA